MSSTKLSQLAQTLIGSEIVSLGAEIKEKIKQGEKIYNYTVGDFDASVFPIPQLAGAINLTFQIVALIPIAKKMLIDAIVKRVLIDILSPQ